MPGKLFTAKNGAKYSKDSRGRVRFVSGASKEYLAKIRKKRGKKKPKGGGLKRKGLGKIASGAAELSYGAYTGSLLARPVTTARAGRRVIRGVRKAKGGFVNAKGPAKRKRRLKGAGLSVHNQATVKFRAKGVKSKTQMGF